MRKIEKNERKTEKIDVTDKHLAGANEKSTIATGGSVERVVLYPPTISRTGVSPIRSR